MQLDIKISLNNSEPGRYGEDEVSRNFAIEIPGTSEDQVNEAKLIQAAEGLASYEDVIPSIINELNMKLEAERESNDKTSAPPAPAPECLKEEDNGPSPVDQDTDPFKGLEPPKDFDDTVRPGVPANPFAANDEEVPQ